MGHRCFLCNDHRLLKSKWFDGKEHRTKPVRLSGAEVLQQLSVVKQPIFGKAQNLSTKQKQDASHLHWTKRSIFFDLPYWKTLTIRHNLDVMHIEKNVCDNMLGMLISIEGKQRIHIRLDLTWSIWV